jgi:hypothetical protein
LEGGHADEGPGFVNGCPVALGRMEWSCAGQGGGVHHVVIRFGTGRVCAGGRLSKRCGWTGDDDGPSSRMFGGKGGRGGGGSWGGEWRALRKGVGWRRSSRFICIKSICTVQGLGFRFRVRGFGC